MVPVSRNAQVLRHFLALSPGGLGRTKLVKLAYLADLEARKLLGRPITSFAYYFHHHGPFDAAIFDAMDELKGRGYAIPQEIDYGDGMIEKRLVTRDPAAAAEGDLDSVESAILDYVAKRYMATKLRDLLDEVVYKSRPMRAVETRGQRLPMEMVDNTTRQRAGFDFAAVIEAENEILSGKYVTPEDLFGFVPA